MNNTRCVSVATGICSRKTNPGYFSGACVVYSRCESRCVDCPSQGPSPTKVSGVFLLALSVLHTIASTFMGGVEGNRRDYPADTGFIHQGCNSHTDERWSFKGYAGGQAESCKVSHCKSDLVHLLLCRGVGGGFAVILG